MCKKMKVLSLIGSLFVVISGMGLFACKTMTSTTKVQDFKSPEWVIKGSGAFKSDRGKIFYGVGSVAGIKDPSLKRQTADNRARNEIAKTFRAYTASLMKDYLTATTSGDFTKTSEEQHVEQAIKTVVSETLSGVVVIDHWEHPSRDEYFSLAELDIESFKNNIDKMNDLSDKVRDYVRKNADRLHDELKAEEEKH